MKEKIIVSFKKISSEKFKFVEVTILMALAAIVGALLGGLIIKKNYGVDKTGVLSYPLQEFINNYNYILNNYYGETDENKLLDKALAGILDDLDDPYSVYMDGDESENLSIYLAGSYRGIGIEVAKISTTQELMITNIFEDSPAEKSGLEVGDILLKINEVSLDDVSSVELAEKIKEQKENFTLTVLRNKKEKVLSVQVDEVSIKSVKSKIVDNKIAYISISSFAKNTCVQLKSELDSINTKNVESLIIDLRNNTGGYLTSVEDVLGLFLDSSHVIYQIQDKTGIKKYYSKGTVTTNYKIVLLTNHLTASASEIMAATLKEELGAKIIGINTYGKGSAQTLHTLSDGSKYKFTTQKWLTPSGNSIDGVGITVDYNVELDSKYYNDPSFENDNQLQYAIKQLNIK